MYTVHRTVTQLQETWSMSVNVYVCWSPVLVFVDGRRGTWVITPSLIMIGNKNRRRWVQRRILTTVSGPGRLIRTETMLLQVLPLNRYNQHDIQQRERHTNRRSHGMNHKRISFCSFHSSESEEEYLNINHWILSRLPLSFISISNQKTFPLSLH